MTDHSLELWHQNLVASGYAARTTRARVEVVQLVARTAGVDPERLETEHILRFLGARDYAPWSRRTYLQHLAAWGAYIGRPEITAGIRRPPVPHGTPDPVSEEDLLRLSDHAADLPRELAWISLGAYAGLRASEVAALHSSQIRRDTLRIRGKGGRIDTLPLAPILRTRLAPWADVTGALWPGTQSARVSHVISLLAAEIDLTLRFHQFRHRFGTAVYRTTRDLLLTQRLMRHSNPQTTTGYAAVADEDARRAIDGLPGATPEDQPP